MRHAEIFIVAILARSGKSGVAKNHIGKWLQLVDISNVLSYFRAMDTSGIPSTFPSAFPRSVLGLLAFVTAFLLCAPLSAQSSEPAAGSWLPQTAGILLPPAALTPAELADAPRIGVDNSWKRLDAALTRLGIGGISETLRNDSQISPRTPKHVSGDVPSLHWPGLAASSPAVPPRLSVPAETLAIGMPPGFLPAERGLITYPTPPPHH